MSENDIWMARRKKLEGAFVDAALALFQHTGSQAFKLKVLGTDPPLFIVGGGVEGIRQLVCADSLEIEYKTMRRFGLGCAVTIGESGKTCKMQRRPSDRDF